KGVWGKGLARESFSPKSFGDKRLGQILPRIACLQGGTKALFPSIKARQDRIARPQSPTEIGKERMSAKLFDLSLFGRKDRLSRAAAQMAQLRLKAIGGHIGPHRPNAGQGIGLGR